LMVAGTFLGMVFGHGGLRLLTMRLRRKAHGAPRAEPRSRTGPPAPDRGGIPPKKEPRAEEAKPAAPAAPAPQAASPEAPGPAPGREEKPPQGPIESKSGPPSAPGEATT
jgi:hypothetical protein